MRLFSLTRQLQHLPQLFVSLPPQQPVFLLPPRQLVFLLPTLQIVSLLLPPRPIFSPPLLRLFALPLLLAVQTPQLGDVHWRVRSSFGVLGWLFGDRSAFPSILVIAG